MLNSFFSRNTTPEPDQKCPPTPDMLIRDVEPPLDERQDIEEKVGLIYQLIRLEQAVEDLLAIGLDRCSVLEELEQAASDVFGWLLSDDEEPLPSVPVQPIQQQDIQPTGALRLVTDVPPVTISNGIQVNTSSTRTHPSIEKVESNRRPPSRRK